MLTKTDINALVTTIFKFLEENNKPTKDELHEFLQKFSEDQRQAKEDKKNQLRPKTHNASLLFQAEMKKQKKHSDKSRKDLGQMWKELTDKQKNEWKKKAEKKNKEEWDTFEKEHPKEAKEYLEAKAQGKKPKESNAPKVLTGYMFYKNQQDPKLKKDYPKMGPRTKQIGALWAALSDESKQKFKDAAIKANAKAEKTFAQEHPEKYKAWLAKEAQKKEEREAKQEAKTKATSKQETAPEAKSNPKGKTKSNPKSKYLVYKKKPDAEGQAYVQFGKAKVNSQGKYTLKWDTEDEPMEVSISLSDDNQVLYVTTDDENEYEYVKYMSGGVWRDDVEGDMTCVRIVHEKDEIPIWVSGEEEE